MLNLSKLLLLIVVAVVLIAAAIFTSPNFAAQAYSFLQQDNKLIDPVEIAPGLYHVGSSNIASYLITTDEGHFLIDGGYKQTAPIILANIEKLGFAPRDVRILLNTHEHFDHAAGLARVKRATGAALYASPEARILLEKGGRGDFYLNDYFAYEPVMVDAELSDGQTLDLGDRHLTAHFTPGHTKGCTSWAFEIEMQGVTQNVLINCSLSTLRYKFAGHESFPGIRAAFENSFVRFKGLPCDIFLGPHGSQFGFLEKMQRQYDQVEQDETGLNPFIDPDGCQSFFDLQEEKFDNLIAVQTNK